MSKPIENVLLSPVLITELANVVLFAQMPILLLIVVEAFLAELARWMA